MNSKLGAKFQNFLRAKTWKHLSIFVLENNAVKQNYPNFDGKDSKSKFLGISKSDSLKKNLREVVEIMYLK